MIPDTITHPNPSANRHPSLPNLSWEIRHELLALHVRELIVGSDIDKFKQSGAEFERKQELLEQVQEAKSLIEELAESPQLDELPLFAWREICLLVAQVGILEEDAEETQKLIDTVHTTINCILPVNEAHLQQLLPPSLTTTHFCALAEQAGDLGFELSEIDQEGRDELNAAARSISSAWIQPTGPLAWKQFVEKRRVKQLYGNIKLILGTLGTKEYLTPHLSTQTRLILAKGAEYWAKKLAEIAWGVDKLRERTGTSAHEIGKRIGRRGPAVLRANYGAITF